MTEHSMLRGQTLVEPNEPRVFGVGAYEFRQMVWAQERSASGLSCARAGNTIATRSRHSPCSSILRTRGEHYWTIDLEEVENSSSPRVRGTRARVSLPLYPDR